MYIDIYAVYCFNLFVCIGECSDKFGRVWHRVQYYSFSKTSIFPAGCQNADASLMPAVRVTKSQDLGG